MFSSSSKKSTITTFTRTYSATNLQDIDSAKSPIAWQIYEEFLGSIANQQKHQIASMFNDYCRQNPHAIECSIYSS
ncbi:MULTISPECIES: CP12 domain-containing protein [Okeania]|uniref:Uncharacterized protein n=1 Tax=Okeania hirsuta TaxID=1458930 RepID=A0A3N6NL23_9CYAN|nr:MULTISPECIES: CP12 domain-containing protein [Okeania]NEP05241.1 hypothetical protein [Okeania sp. SIO4D6]NEP40433.1 hypothetical protein [Okeania sp. SIO2H7]NET12824.1 hypothetical protein [Okeania sp. SIO1H6]NEP72342.1 hypothetical protein [Okeania sp. SIO2G5]NEP94324.1 hypothetical protein [Okeania sp. SIO2F5]